MPAPVAFIPTPLFVKQIRKLARKFPSLQADFDALIETLKTAPATGQPLGQDCYKIRLAISSKGKGKSGGARIITCVKIIDNTVYLLTIFDKSDQANISDKQLESLLKLLE